MKARIHVFYKEGVFDPQGNTVAQSLQRLGFNQVQGVRIGKVIDLELTSKTGDEARRDLQKMCDKLLVNPVIESFKFEVHE